MSLVTWLILGLIGGFIGSKIVNRSGSGLLLDIVLGVVGAIAGGLLFNAFGTSGINRLNFYNSLVALVGSILLLVFYHMIIRRVPTR